MTIDEIEKTYKDVKEWYQQEHSGIGYFYMFGQSKLFKMLAWVYLNELDPVGESPSGEKVSKLKEKWMDLHRVQFIDHDNDNTYAEEFGTGAYKIVNRFFDSHGYVLVDYITTYKQPKKILDTYKSWLMQMSNSKTVLNNIIISPFEENSYFYNQGDTAYIGVVDNYLTYLENPLNFNPNIHKNVLFENIDFFIAHNKQDLVRAVVERYSEQLSNFTFNNTQSISAEILCYIYNDTPELIKRLKYIESLHLTAEESASLLLNEDPIIQELTLPTLA